MLVRGFSALELLVVLGLVAILMVMGTLQFVRLDSAAKNSTAWQIFQADIARARSEAASRGTRIIVRAEGDGYVVGEDVPPYNEDPEEDSVIYTRIFPTGITANFPSVFIFDSRGILVTEAEEPTDITVTFLRGTETLGELTINSFGGVL